MIWTRMQEPMPLDAHTIERMALVYCIHEDAGETGPTTLLVALRNVPAAHRVVADAHISEFSLLVHPVPGFPRDLIALCGERGLVTAQIVLPEKEPMVAAEAA